MISYFGGPHFFHPSSLAKWKEKVMHVLEEDPDRKNIVRLSDMLFCFSQEKLGQCENDLWATAIRLSSHLQKRPTTMQCDSVRDGDCMGCPAQEGSTKQVSYNSLEALQQNLKTEIFWVCLI